MTGYIATAETDIDATPEEIWAVLTDPAKLSELWFGAQVVTDWQVGSPITWSGVWEGRPYEDKGEVLAVEPGRLLKFTHFSPLTGQPDVPENYHTLTYTLTGDGTTTHLELTQDNNASADEAAHAEGMWQMLMTTVKQAAEGSPEA